MYVHMHQKKSPLSYVIGRNRISPTLKPPPNLPYFLLLKNNFLTFCVMGVGIYNHNATCYNFILTWVKHSLTNPNRKEISYYKYSTSCSRECYKITKKHAVSLSSHVKSADYLLDNFNFSTCT